MNANAPYGAAAACFPGEAELAALRGWYAGVKARDAIARYLGPRPREDAVARSALDRLRKRPAAYALARHRPDLAAVFLASPARNDSTAVSRAIEGAALDSLTCAGNDRPGRPVVSLPDRERPRVSQGAARRRVR